MEEQDFWCFADAKNEARAKKQKRGWGWGRGRKETLTDKPLDFENLRSPAKFNTFDRHMSIMFNKLSQSRGFQNPGVCLQAFPSFPSPNPLFRFLALPPFFAWAKHQKTRSSVFLYSYTPQKHLLRRLSDLLHIA